MGLFDAATGGMTGGVGALFGGGASPSSAMSGALDGKSSTTFGDFFVGGSATSAAGGISPQWLAAAASLAGLAITIYYARRK